MSIDWYEVWADDGLAVPYLLILRPCADGTFEVIDPKEGDRRAFHAETHEAARLWLLEDEYERVGRVSRSERCDRGEPGSGEISIGLLGGELWAEMRRHIPEATVGWLAKNDVVQLAMAVLARHAGARIYNDEDFPVTPLPRDGPG